MAKRYYKSRKSFVNTVSNDRADLPKDVMMPNCPELPTGGFTDYDDTINGIDARIKKSIKSINRKGKTGRW